MTKRTPGEADVRQGQSPVRPIDPDARRRGGSGRVGACGPRFPEVVRRRVPVRGDESTTASATVGRTMSSLWTPSGEHPVDRPGDRAPTGPSAGGPATPPPAAPPEGEPELTPDERAAAEEYARRLDDARQQLVEVPAGLVVGQ